MDEPKDGVPGVQPGRPQKRADTEGPTVHFAAATLVGEGTMRIDARQFGARPVEVYGARWVQVGYGLPGRPATDPGLILEMQAALEEHWRDSQSKPKQYDGVVFILGRLKDMGQRMGQSTVLREVVAPVHRRRWP